MPTTTKKKTQTEEVERPSYKVEPRKVKPGDLMALIHYVKVRSITPGCDKMSVTNLNEGNNFDIFGSQLIANCLSADQYAEEVEVTKTKAAEILVSSHNRPLTVSFEKADKSIRVLRGKLVNPEPLLGRSHCEDFDVEIGENRLRLVDHRTIQFLIVDGVKYNVK